MHLCFGPLCLSPFFFTSVFVVGRSACCCQPPPPPPPPPTPWDEEAPEVDHLTEASFAGHIASKDHTLAFFCTYIAVRAQPGAVVGVGALLVCFPRVDDVLPRVL